jgi:hypothetical protein
MHKSIASHHVLLAYYGLKIFLMSPTMSCKNFLLSPVPNSHVGQLASAMKNLLACEIEAFPDYMFMVPCCMLDWGHTKQVQHLNFSAGY